MTKPLYTAQARVTGGRHQGRGRTADGELDVELRPPKELGGEGGGANPEQLFAIGYAACFEASMMLAAQRVEVPFDHVADAAVDAKVMLFPAEPRTIRLGVELAVELPSLTDPAQATELVRVAHSICPYSNAVRGNVGVAITVNGVDPSRNLVELGEIAPRPVWDGVRARVVQGERLTLGIVEIEPDGVVPAHDHPNEQLGMVIEGSVTFRVGDEVRRLGPGGTWRIPGDVPHELRAGADGAVVIDLFTPTRDDWTAIEPEPLRPPRWPS